MSNNLRTKNYQLNELRSALAQYTNIRVHGGSLANPITDHLKTGTLGELFVQLKLLEFDIQAAPPLKDSGNDLVAFRGRVVKTIQVKTTTNSVRRPNSLPETYDLLALVKIDANDVSISWDSSNLYLIPKSELGANNALPTYLSDYELGERLVETLFGGHEL